MEEPIRRHTEQWYSSYPSTSGFAANLEYFNKGNRENEEFWRCFGGLPSFEQQTVVEVGCGHGSLCIHTALAAASSRVIGVDTDAERIDFANWNLHTNYPALESRVEFHCTDIRHLPVSDVDAVLSKAAFEHIINLDEVLNAIKARLKAGGRLYAGFDPLYYSPFGGHGRIHNALPFPWLPWGHLLVSQRYVLSRVNRLRGEPVSSMAELGLNSMSVGDYRRAFGQSGMRVVSFKTNLPGESRRAKAVNALSRVRFLEKYATYSVFAVLEKPT